MHSCANNRPTEFLARRTASFLSITPPPSPRSGAELEFKLRWVFLRHRPVEPSQHAAVQLWRPSRRRLRLQGVQSTATVERQPSSHAACGRQPRGWRRPARFTPRGSEAPPGLRGQACGHRPFAHQTRVMEDLLCQAKSDTTHGLINKHKAIASSPLCRLGHPSNGVASRNKKPGRAGPGLPRANPTCEAWPRRNNG
jgi:hypothetical protein